MSQSHIDQLMNVWAASLQSADPNATPPFANHQDLLDTIDATPDGNVPWERFTVTYSGPKPTDREPPAWMFQEYEICFRNAKKIVANMLSNRDFDGEFDYTPHKDFDQNGDRMYKNLFSADWIWLQAVILLSFISRRLYLFFKRIKLPQTRVSSPKVARFSLFF